MSKFPKPLTLPDKVFEARDQRQRDVFYSATQGIFIRCFIIVIEMLGFAYFGSYALFLDGLATLVDVGSSLLLLIIIRMAARPPDRDHPFGHGRYEPLMGLQFGVIMAIVGGGMFVQQVYELFLGTLHTERLDPRAWMIPLVAIILLEIAYRLMMSVAKKQKSEALKADAYHYRTDAITSVFALIALIVAALFPNWSNFFDHLGAIIISAVMVIAGIIATKGNLSQLMDKPPPKEFFDLVKSAAMRVEGTRATEKIRIQQYGPDAHVDIDIEVDPQLPVDAAHTISQKVRIEIQKEWPAVRDVTVHIEPYYPGDH